MQKSTIRRLVQAAAFAACLAGTLQATPEVERTYFNGKDFKGGQLIVPKLPPDKADTKRWVVIGVSAHSAGSWAGVKGWGEINDKAKGIPFVLSCGELDTGKAFDGKAPHSRLEWMKVFSEDLKKRGFAVRSEVHPGKGHGVSVADHSLLIRECFLLATEGIVPEENKWSGDIKPFTEN